MVRTPGFHPGDPGSIPGRGNFIHVRMYRIHAYTHTHNPYHCYHRLFPLMKYFGRVMQVANKNIYLWYVYNMRMLYIYYTMIIYIFLVPGFELATFCLRGRCNNHWANGALLLLSYIYIYMEVPGFDPGASCLQSGVLFQLNYRLLLSSYTYA